MMNVFSVSHEDDGMHKQSGIALGHLGKESTERLGASVSVVKEGGSRQRESKRMLKLDR